MPTLAQASPNYDALAQDPVWHKLLHYKTPQRPFASPGSVIHDSTFFVSANGQTDSVAELRASLDALLQPANHADTHFRCRFPARAAWLEQKLGHSTEFDLRTNCPTYFNWTRDGNIASLSIVFATGYLGNPASYYGHTLLKFNSPGESQSTDLLDVTVNYGAIHDGRDNPVSYIVKGIFGGYDAVFSHIDFYYHNHQYGENELRDLWEYQLDLPKDRVDFIVAHAWEVLGKRYTYYFFRENCAYRMTEVLEIVDGLDLIPKNRPWTIPQALIQRLDQAQWDGRKLVSKRVYRPSRQSRFYGKFRELSDDEATLFRNLASGKLDFTSAEYHNAPLASRQKILGSILDYHRFTESLVEAGPPSRAYRTALAERFKLPPGPPEVDAPPPTSPHSGRPPSWLQLGYFSHPSRSGLSLRLRPAYYDALDSDGSHVANAALSMGDVQLTVSGGKTRLGKFDLIAIESVNKGLSGLPGDRGFAWKLRAGAEQASPDCHECLLARVQGDIGVGRQLTRSLFGAAYLGGAIQDNRHGEGLGFARASVDFILKLSPALSMKTSVEHRHPFNSQRKAQAYGKAELRWAFNARSDLRLSLEQGKIQTLGLGLGVYW